MMTTILVTLFVSVAGILVVNYFKGRGKRSSERTSTEKIAHSINASIKKGLHDIERGVRTPDVIRMEIEQEFENATNIIKEKYSVYIRELYMSINRHKSNIAKSSKNVREYKEKALELKNKYIETQDKQYLDLSKKFISAIIQQEKNIEKSKNIVEQTNNKIYSTKMEFDLAMSDIYVKRSNIIDFINDPKLFVGQVKLNIDDLIFEFNQRTEEMEINQNVSEFINGGKEKENNDVSNTEVDEMFENL